METAAVPATRKWPAPLADLDLLVALVAAPVVGVPMTTDTALSGR